jgi:type I restriction enzyme R subunit
VDKNLKMHGLLQAYSRTNRILNAVKNCGNIVCFRNLEDATNKSLAIFGDDKASGLVFMKSFDEYYRDGYEDEKGNFHEPYIELVRRLLEQYPVEQIANILDEETKKNFIRLFGEFLRVRNVLSAFDDFEGDRLIVSESQFQDYRGWYNTLHDEFRPKVGGEQESITDDIVFEMELIKQVQVNISFILQLVQQYHDTNCEDKTIIVSIRKQVEASPDMRDKRDLIEKFIESMTPEKGKNVGDDWEAFIEEEKKRQLNVIIKEEHLKPAETEAFMARAFADGYVTETGTGIAKILPPVNPFLPESGEKKQTVIDKLKAYLTKFIGTMDDVAMPKVSVKRKGKPTATELRFIPAGSMLEHIEDDADVRRLIHNMMALDEGTTIMKIVVECQKQYQERYFSMKANEWRHLIRDYVREVTERPELNEEEVFRFSLAG